MNFSLRVFFGIVALSLVGLPISAIAEVIIRRTI
jgi:hypothetical protein